ncbi:hypothetical protein M0R45_010884 [Rubus argutus]|uniref:Uncharacterized protein n=1 Tax=Rubus argutus TaxID=59490 RepID=A0AAW1Y8M0_RUBAR
MGMRKSNLQASASVVQWYVVRTVVNPLYLSGPTLDRSLPHAHFVPTLPATTSNNFLSNLRAYQTQILIVVKPTSPQPKSSSISFSSFSFLSLQQRQRDERYWTRGKCGREEVEHWKSEAGLVEAMGCQFDSMPTWAEIETCSGGDESEAWIDGSGDD